MHLTNMVDVANHSATIDEMKLNTNINIYVYIIFFATSLPWFQYFSQRHYLDSCKSQIGAEQFVAGSRCKGLGTWISLKAFVSTTARSVSFGQKLYLKRHPSRSSMDLPFHHNLIYFLRMLHLEPSGNVCTNNREVRWVQFQFVGRTLVSPNMGRKRFIRKQWVMFSHCWSEVWMVKWSGGARTVRRNQLTMYCASKRGGGPTDKGKRP